MKERHFRRGRNGFMWGNPNEEVSKIHKTPTVGELPVADVLQVGPGVLAHVLGGGDGTLLQLRLSPADLGTLAGRDAA